MISTPEQLVIVGAGGHGLDVLWAAQAMGTRVVLGYADSNAARIGEIHYGQPILCLPEDVPARFGPLVRFHLAVGDNRDRMALAAQLESSGLRAATVIHPDARLAPGASVSEGSYVAAGATLAPHCALGRHVIVNVNAVIGHQSKLADFAQIGPGAAISGGCHLGLGTFVGANACLHQGVETGDWASVAANSFAVTRVGPGETVMGIPARTIFHRK